MGNSFSAEGSYTIEDVTSRWTPKASCATVHFVILLSATAGRAMIKFHPGYADIEINP
jgi:hypothetical protein